MESKLKVLVAIAAVSLVTLVGCSEQNEDNNKEELKTSSTVVQEKADTKLQETTTDKESDEAASGAETKKVGTEEYGYINVPNDWVNFKDIDGNTSFQVSKIDQSQIISLNIFNGPEGSTLEDAANSVAYNMENGGAIDIKGARVKIKDYDALQVYGSYENGAKMLVAWLFKSNDGKIRYIAAEGTKEGIMEAVGYIENGGWSAN